MKLLHAVSRRRTLLCVAVVLLFLAVVMTFVHAQEVAATPTDAADKPGAQHTSVPTETSEEEARAATAAVQAAETEAAAVRQLEAEEQARREEEEKLAELHRRQQEEERRREEEEKLAELHRRQQEEERRREEEEKLAELRRRQQEEERRREEEEKLAELRRRQQEEERRRQEEERRRQEEQEELERRDEEERAKRRIDSVDMIRYSAEELPQGCAKSIQEYLFRVHEHRQHTAAAVRDARSELNEALVHAPNKVAELEKRLAARQDDLLVYDIQTLRMYGGSVPKTCIAESKAWLDTQPDVSSMSEVKQRLAYFFRLTFTHCKVLYLTARGVMQYMIDSYTPVVKSYTKSVQYYCDKASAIYAELLPASGKQLDMPMMDLAKKIAVMVGYAAVPVGLVVAAGIFAVAVLPLMVAAVIMYEYVYKVWLELFIAYYTYGAKMPDGAVTAVKSTVAAARAGEWASIGNSLLDALLDLVSDSDADLYNGVVAVYLVCSIAVVCVTFICLWFSCCVSGMRGKKGARPLHAASRSASDDRSGIKKAPATGGAAAAAAKKKN
ncbi:conserved hypothetical protein [Leishmania major strain Friedlin]|uniref:Uncharacterized protein L7836.08 n=1 Tax=Leishmania major TaxID=5664 RepID=Q9U0V4_LEIMA|nr:conserved hypothetical protein [Leishmania major strain Friedlin]CAB55383.1 hypothetical protein L7836.08 [Leishmania major]CAG9574228.1 hypothetical_protein_-_conserved [Leishmania major strain Friedlin]CAJ04351.1 conserved hypothetical protein [Leishmania major strain Friedlin]|eukprot:XP_001683399.1 conserved hypothetical protein [Leishmania major strain Friedlin]